jgi:aminopeptidase N
MPELDRSQALRRLTSRGSDFEDATVAPHYPPDLELEPVHLDIDLAVDLATETASGTVTTTVRSRRDDPADLVLNAVEFRDLGVTAPDGQELTWHYDGDKIKIHWASPFKTNEERQVAVTYRVTSPADGLLFSQPDEGYPDKAWYATTDHETERARYWLPCVDLPSVRTTLEFHLRAKDRFTILANGYLVEEVQHRDGTKTAHWKLDQLCPSYLVCFAIGDFVRAADGSLNDGEKQVELTYFCSPEFDDAALIRSFGRTGRIMAWMTKKLDMPFPYPKYYQYALPDLGGAMENISLVSWSDRLLLDEAMAEEYAWIVDSVNVHEMAHSYFGDAVVIRDFAHAWLKESWATYLEHCWQEDEFGEDEAQYLYYTDAETYFREADEQYHRPIVTRRFKSSWQLYDNHLYPGGACRLHTLRRELGDEVFWKATRDYLKRFIGKVVETDDLRYVMEKHSGRSLGKFFDQWFHSPGYPHIKVGFSFDEGQKQGTFEIEQTQVDEEKKIGTFDLSVDLSWIIDGEKHHLPVKLDQPKHTFIVAMSAEPEQVRFDPGRKALHKLSFNPGDPMLCRQLTGADDVIGRIQAAHELAKSGKRANIEAIVAAYDDESFWGTREQFAKALGKANTDAAIDGLAHIIREESDARALAPIFRAAGTYRDERIKEALGDRLRGQLPPAARRAAYEAMGAQRKEADWELLLEGSRQPGYNGIAQSGAFVGLAATRREEALDILQEQIPYGVHSNRVRPAMVSALADIGRVQEKAGRERVIEALEDLLRDPWYFVRWGAATALGKMKAVESASALESFSRTVSYQDRVRVEKMVADLRAGDKSEGAPSKKHVEELGEKVRKLEDRLQKLEAKLEAQER